MGCQELKEFDNLELLLNRLNHDNISPPALCDPLEITKRFNNKIRSMNAWIILYINVLCEAEKLNIYNVRVIKRVTEIVWNRANSDDKRMWRDRAREGYKKSHDYCGGTEHYQIRTIMTSPRIQDDIQTLQARHDLPAVPNVASAPAVSTTVHRCPCASYQERQFNVLQGVNSENTFGLEKKVIPSKKFQDVIIDGDPEYPF
ncbi:9611_t:CDS:2 [Acaulospora morrowiae]|uniref:9611_t:CDS:1 n=1 Tax=Acaulospora morrowiae TaxID=94023 RepID=A0A9N8V8D5_9GLOM|nr:9611_t:CDS:2 [Acaulospora morrowiae]